MADSDDTQPIDFIGKALYLVREEDKQRVKLQAELDYLSHNDYWLCIR